MDNPDVVVVSEDSTQGGKRERQSGWFKSPWVSVLGGAVAVASLVFGVWGWWSGAKDRDLVYLVHSPRTVVFQKAVGGDFDVSFKGVPVDSDVKALSITLWNDGREAIRRNHVVGKPPTIQLSPPVPIYSMKVVSQSRPEVVKFELDGTKAESGTVGITWDILDKDDGANIQLIYASPSDAEVDVQVHADFEGRASAQKVSLRNAVFSTPMAPRWVGLLLSVLSFFLAAVTITKAFAVYSRVIRLKRIKGLKLPSDLKNDLVQNAFLVLLWLIITLYWGTSEISKFLAYQPTPPVF